MNERNNRANVKEVNTRHLLIGTLNK